MPDNRQTHPVQMNDSQDRQRDLVRQDYAVRVSEGRTCVVPNALEEAELPLAIMHKPDFSKAQHMPGGVRILFK